ncbi:hypothetical protein FACS189425_06410 [Clostridia bacterium]|nr:hypothetical protein FACS189425_06410 [Clostridia bacterium]
MREILFRGKRQSETYYNGEWAIGDLVHNSGGTLSIHTDNLYFTVDPSTICQFTGEYDCEEKRIFEGDIIEIFNGWDAQGDLAYIEWNDDPDSAIGGFAIKLNSQYGKAWVDCFLDDDDTPAVRVIGNIHDNPELLEGSK